MAAGSRPVAHETPRCTSTTREPGVHDAIDEAAELERDRASTVMLGALHIPTSSGHSRRAIAGGADVRKPPQRTSRGSHEGGEGNDCAATLESCEYAMSVRAAGRDRDRDPGRRSPGCGGAAHRANPVAGVAISLSSQRPAEQPTPARLTTGPVLAFGHLPNGRGFDIRGGNAPGLPSQLELSAAVAGAGASDSAIARGDQSGGSAILYPARDRGPLALSGVFACSGQPKVLLLLACCAMPLNPSTRRKADAT